MQQFINHLMDLHPIWPHLSRIRLTVYRLLTRPSNSSTKAWRQNTLTGRRYNLLSFNCRVISHYCTTCFSLRLEQLPSVILPLKSPLSALKLALILTLLQLPSYFPALITHKVVVLPWWARWDHPEQKQTILQTLISSPYPTCSKLLELRRRTSHQEFPKLFCRWNSNLYIYHCGDTSSILFLIW